MIKEPLSKTDPKLYRQIKALYEEIWVEHIDPNSKYRWCDEKRELTDKEKELLFSLIKSKCVICCLHEVFGFTLVLSLYSYPASTDEKPEFLISFSQRHMGIKNSGLNGTEKRGEETAWKVFSKFTHTKQNKRAVEFFGLPPIREKESYAY